MLFYYNFNFFVFPTLIKVDLKVQKVNFSNLGFRKMFSSAFALFYFVQVAGSFFMILVYHTVLKTLVAV